MTTDSEGRIRRTTVDGVRVFYGHSPLPFAAALLFRVGRADETLVTSGVTHLVEHLALPSGRVRGLEFNGLVDGTTTTFWADGPREQVLEFLAATARNLAGLDLDRLDRERGILLTEAGGAGMDNVRLAASLRYGPNGYGLIGHDELGLYGLRAEDAAAWAAERFTRASVALCLTGDPPDELDLGLPEGALIDPPQVAPLPYLELPAVFPHGMGGRVSVSLEGRRTHELAAGFSLAQERLRHRLRDRAGLTYSVDGWYEPTSRERAHAVLSADCLDENADSVRSGLLTALSDLVDRGPTAEELEHEAEETRRSMKDPHSLFSGLLYAAVSELGSDGFRTEAQLLAERQALTPGAVSDALAAALESMLLLVPEGASLPGGRFKPYPLRSPAALDGKRHRRSGLRNLRSDETLVAGPDGVAFETPQHRNAVRFDACAAVLTWQHGPRGLWSTDGFYVYVDPSEWRGGKGLTDLVDRHTPETLRIPVDEITPLTSDPALVRAFELAEEPGKAAEAIPLFEEGLEREPNVGAAWGGLAWCLLEVRRYGEAMRAAERAVELDPDVELAHRVLAYALWHTNRRDEAAEAISRALDLEPAEPQTLSDFAWFLAEVSRFDDARRAAERAVELFPEHGSSWFARGWVATGRGEWEDAERDLRKALELQPKESMWHNNLGWLLLKAGRPDEAERCFREALSLDRDNSFAAWNRVLALRLVGKPKEAAELKRKLASPELERLQRVVDAEPGDAHARSRLAHRLHADGRAEEAVEQARAAAAAAASDHVEPQLELAGWLADAGRLDEAREALQARLERAPDDPTAHYYRAWLGAVTDDAASAAEAAAAALARNDDDFRTWLTAGYAEIAAGRWAEARRWLERTQRREPLNCCAHVWNGVALSRLGDREGAAAVLERGELLHPGCECCGVQRLRRELAG